MTRWLRAALTATEGGTKLTKPQPEPVLSVKSVLSGEGGTASVPIRADGLDPDAAALLAHIQTHGPTTYGAASLALRWGASRAWRAEEVLRARGLVMHICHTGMVAPTSKASPK